MYKVAICEDEAIFRHEQETICREVLDKLNIEHQITVFEAGTDFWAAFSGGARFDLLLLDIVMDEISGMELALKIRQPYLCLEITNARSGDLIVSGNSYSSTKNAPVLHGHGIAVVRKIVEKHEGLISIEHTDDKFSVEIALPVV